MRTLLLAEPHGPTREHLAARLSQAGFTVSAVETAEALLERFNAELPTVLLLAVDFPRHEGTHVGQTLRATERGARLPIVAIDKGHLGKARGVGAVLGLKVDAYVADPLRLGELLQRLEALLGQAGREATSRAKSPLSQTLARTPVHAGPLRGLPLPELVHGLFRTRRDGILVATHGALTRRVFFRAGMAVAYDSTARQDTLPAHLVERGRLDPTRAERVVAALQSGLRLAAALLEAGVETEPEETLQLLRDYNRDKVAQVIGMREGRFGFYAGDEFLPGIVGVEGPALAPILEAGRRSLTLKQLAAPLRAHLRAFPHRTARFAEDLAQLGLDTQDLKLAMRVNGRIPLADLLAFGRGDLRAAHGLFWFLRLVEAVSFSRTPLGSEGAHAAGAEERLPPRKRKPLPREQADALREAALKVITGSYFQVLGLDVLADTAAVERAYAEVAARFHPDSYPEHDLTPLEDLLDTVQEKLAASHKVLASEEKRRAYLQYLLSRLDVGRSAAVNVDAELVLRRGEAALKRREWRTALGHFEQAVAQNPREPEYCSYLAWATYKAGRGDRAERAREAQKVLRKALAQNPYLERALVISAIIEGEGGDAPAARKKLLKVLEMNPASRLAKAALLKLGR